MTKIGFDSDSGKFDMDLIKVGQENCAPSKLRESSMRYYYSLHYILSGWGTLEVGGKAKKLTKGDLFLIYRGEEVAYYPNASDPWSYVWIDFNGNDLNELLADYGFTEENPYVRPDNPAAFLAQAIQPLIDDCDSGPVSLVTSGDVLKLFGMLMRNNRTKKSRRDNIGAAQRINTLREILTFVNNNYRTNLTVPCVCEKMYISEYQLNSLFKECMGTTFVNYVNRYRISEACEMLLHEDIGITEAAHRVGIEDIAYFSRLFVKWKGVSPRDYRKECADDAPFAWLKGTIFDVR